MNKTRRRGMSFTRVLDFSSGYAEFYHYEILSSKAKKSTADKAHGRRATMNDSFSLNYERGKSRKRAVTRGDERQPVNGNNIVSTCEEGKVTRTYV